MVSLSSDASRILRAPFSDDHPQKGTAPGGGPEAVRGITNLATVARTSSSELPLDASPLS
jgi:hypothetical protein